MKILPKPLTFEWDKGNTDKNLIRHGVTDKESEEVFSNKPLLIHKDIKHSKVEERFQALGRTDQGRKLFLSFTIRKDKVRIISSHDMSRRERRMYEEKIKVNSKV